MPESATLVLGGVNIACASSAPIFVGTGTGVTTIVLKAGTQNFVSDGAVYTNLDEDGEPDATIFSKSDLVITGTGSLSIDANYNNGLKSKDVLTIESGTIIVDAVDDAIVGRDQAVVRNGNITVQAGGDGLKSTNDEDTDKGNVTIEGGTIHITCGADAVQAETTVVITGGELTLVTAGGSSVVIPSTATAKGVKGTTSVTIRGGDFTINAADDALHSNGTLAIEGGTFTLASADDAIHADTSLVISGGTTAISKSCEGLESKSITINGGQTTLVSSDDGVNTSDGSGAMSGNWPLSINGGYLAVCAGAGGA